MINNSFEYLRPIVEGVLKKDMTMTNRLLIWQNAVSEIKSNLLFGHGYLMGSDAYNLLGIFPGTYEQLQHIATVIICKCFLRAD